MCQRFRPHQRICPSCLFPLSCCPSPSLLCPSCPSPLHRITILFSSQLDLMDAIVCDTPSLPRGKCESYSGKCGIGRRWRSEVPKSGGKNGAEERLLAPNKQGHTAAPCDAEVGRIGGGEREEK